MVLIKLICPYNHLYGSEIKGCIDFSPPSLANDILSRPEGDESHIHFLNTDPHRSPTQNH